MLGTASNTSHHILQTLTQLKINGRKQRQSDEKQENQLSRYLNQNYLVRLYHAEGVAVRPFGSPWRAGISIRH